MRSVYYAQFPVLLETVPTLAIDAVSPAAVTIWEKEVGAEPDWIKSALRHSWVKVTVIA